MTTTIIMTDGAFFNDFRDALERQHTAEMRRNERVNLFFTRRDGGEYKVKVNGKNPFDTSRMAAIQSTFNKLIGSGGDLEGQDPIRAGAFRTKNADITFEFVKNPSESKDEVGSVVEKVFFGALLLVRAFLMFWPPSK